jgi:transcriptional/translational regulatory protein YebC/TACO1
MEVLTDPQDFLRVRASLERAGLVAGHAEVTRRSSVQTALDGHDAEVLMQLVDALDELDDVQHVYTNADLPAELLAPA